MIKKSLTLFGLASCLLAQAQNQAPEVTSWIQNTEGKTHSRYELIINKKDTVGANTVETNDEVNVQLVQYSNNYVYVQATGLPEYQVGPYLDGNPSQASDQGYTWKIPRNPQEETGTKTTFDADAIGVLIDGTAVYDPSDDQYYISSGQQKLWKRNAGIMELEGQDCGGGHPQQQGAYHHHIVPSSDAMTVATDVCVDYPAEGLMTLDASKHSPLIGFAIDGYPIYGPYGYENTDGTGEIVRIQSSYVTRSYPNGKRTRLNENDPQDLPQDLQGPDVDETVNGKTYPLGAFYEDYYYQSGAGHLDEYNGRFAVTPEYPNGTYCYYTTINADMTPAYPYFIGEAFYGKVDQSILNARGLNTVSEPVETFTPGDVLAVEDEEQGNALISYPNPATDFSSLQMANLMGQNVEISILDGMGITHQVEKVHVNTMIHQLDLRNLATGNYIVQVVGEQGTYSTQLIVQ